MTEIHILYMSNLYNKSNKHGVLRVWGPSYHGYDGMTPPSPLNDTNNSLDSPECLVKKISTVRDTSWMAIYLRSCDSILVSYNDILGKPMVSFWLVMCCCGWVGQNTIGGGGSKYYDSKLTPRSKYYIVFWPGVILPRGQNTIPHLSRNAGNVFPATAD